jgi:soluble lytic murein transglycosylase-like protein
MTSSLQSSIEAAAVSAGVDPGIALAVAQVESGGNQAAVSSAGAIGVFQLLAATAVGLGVNPNDLNGNISGGIAYLGQMMSQFGNWQDALAAYNWGPGNVQNVINAGGGFANYPASVQAYVNNVLSLSQSYDGGSVSGLTTPILPGPTGELVDSLVPSTTTGMIAAGVAGLVFLYWLID